MNNFIDQELYDDIKFGTNIISGEEYRQTLLAISELASEMVVKTLGPYGKTTIVDDNTFTYPTKDGWTVLKKFRFNDPIYNCLYEVLKQVSFSLVNKVGDGTTSALIGANIFMHFILQYQESNEFRQIEFLNAIKDTASEIINALQSSEYVHHIDTDGDFSDIKRIAEIASNGDTKLSSIIQDIYTKTNNPNIYVQFDQGDSITGEVQTGFKLDAKVLNHKVYVNDASGVCIKSQKSMVAIFDHNVTYREHANIITGLSRYANAHNSEIIIVAPNFDDIITDVIGTSINSFIQQNQVPNIMMIQVPISKNIHRQYLTDLIMLTNGQVFNYGKIRACNAIIHNQTATEEDDKIEDALLNTDGYKFDSVEDLIKTCIGYANKLIIGEKYLILQNYEAIVNKQQFENTITEVKEHYIAMKQKANKSTSMLLNDYMDAYQRYTKLIGNMGIIKVGGKSELEKHCMKDTVDDAVLACRSAFDNGYIRGMNLATLQVITNMLNASVYDTLSTKWKVLQMFKSVFYEMSMCVMRNKESDDIRRPVMEYNITGKVNMCNSEIIEYAIANDCGYNMVTEKFESDDECTVINSVSTDVEIINGMVSILSLMLTSNQFLSINRAYDRTMGKKQVLNKKIENQTVIAEAVTEAVASKLDEVLSKMVHANTARRKCIGHNSIIGKLIYDKLIDSHIEDLKQEEKTNEKISIRERFFGKK